MNNNIKHSPVIGAIYGQWTVISDRTKVNSSKDRNMYWHVRCSCGAETFRGAYTLVNGKTKACMSCAKTVFNEDTYIARYFKWKVQERASNNGFECSIDVKYLEELFSKQDGKCAISGVPLKFERYKEIHKSTASLDRIDNSLGYVRGNVQWVHKDVNMARGSMSQESFIKMCKIIAQYNG
jgi:hypothetical protein